MVYPLRCPGIVSLPKCVLGIYIAENFVAPLRMLNVCHSGIFERTRCARDHASCTSYSKYRPDGSIFVLFSNSCHSSADTSSGRVTSGVSVWNTLPAHFCMSVFL